MKQHPPKEQILKLQGFSLIEVLIALVILGVGLLGLAKLQSVVMLNSADSRMYSQGMVIAQDKIEELRAYANRDSYDSIANGNEGNDIVGSNTVFNRSWIVSNATGTGNKQISVLVTWQSINGEQQEIRLTSNIAETEPAKSGMVLASINTVGVSAAQSAAQAAAHAAAAARYEALVAASGAEDVQKQAAQEALDRAQDAADAAQDAADNNNAEEAARQAELAQTAMNEIIDIINAILETSFPKFIDGNADPGTTSVAMALGPTENGFCIMLDSDSYSCVISSLEDSVTIEGIRDDGERTSCVTPLLQGDDEQVMFDGCYLSYSNDCLAPWSPDITIAEGSFIEAFETSDAIITDGQSCVKQERYCENGVLNGSFLYENCQRLCKVPNAIGLRLYINILGILILDLNSDLRTWQDNGGSITFDVGILKKIKSQSLPPGSLAPCNSELNLSVNN